MTVKRITFGGHPQVSVITPTIVGRGHFLEENKASVAAQTITDYEHLILLDIDRDGCAITMNRLAKEARGEWLFILADDDLILPNCLRAHLEVSGGADVVWAFPLVWDKGRSKVGEHYPPGLPASALIRTEVWHKHKGYREDLQHCEDQELFIRIKQRKGVFVGVGDVPTWIVRFHGENKSRSQLGVAPMIRLEPVINRNPDNITDPGTTLDH